jgi:hypothetical protein
MPSVIVHFPDGSKEFRYPENGLEEGDVISHAGSRFRVVSVNVDGDRQSVTVVAANPDDLKDLLTSEEGSIELQLLEPAVEEA